MSLRTAYRVDAPSLNLPLTDAAGRRIGEAEIALRTNANTGALEFVAPLTWTGVREYFHADGSVTRELRRPEQVKSPSHMRGLRLITATADHPRLEDGTPVYLDARGGPGAKSPDGSALRPAKDYEVGHVGDEIVDGEIDGYYVPLGRVACTDLVTQRRIAGGRTQTSLGYTALLDDTGGTWDGPHGPEEYDVEHVLDHDDPRVLEAVDAGILPTVDRLIGGEIIKVPILGPNHFAIAIWAGRGEMQSEIVDFMLPVLDSVPRRVDSGSFVRRVADSAPAHTDTRLVRAMQTARIDRIATGLPAAKRGLQTAPLTGQYDLSPCAACVTWGMECAECLESAGHEWLGWIDGTDDIAFIATDGLGLWWSQRSPDGGVIGSPVAFAWRGAMHSPVLAPAAECEHEAEAEGSRPCFEIVISIEDAVSEHSARQQSPGKFDKFLRFAMPNGVSLLLGCKGTGPWQVQSVRFPSDEWKPTVAKKWLSAVGLSSSSFEIAPEADSESADISPDDVSFVAQEKSATYAHPVRGDAADLEFLTMRKILIPARFADAASALATAVKAPIPAKVADAAMLEVELPEGADPVMLAAGMHALAGALEKMSSAMGETEAAQSELGADYAKALQELDAKKAEIDAANAKVDALVADAEVGRAARLEQVVAIARKAGLVDADVTGKSADEVRAAACAKQYPSAKHLDQKSVLDNLWIALQDRVTIPAVVAVAAAVAATPAPVVTPAPELRPAPQPRSDNDGKTTNPAPAPKRHSLHSY